MAGMYALGILCWPLIDPVTPLAPDSRAVSDADSGLPVLETTGPATAASTADMD
jgi:hypothetical protein